MVDHHAQKKKGGRGVSNCIMVPHIVKQHRKSTAVFLRIMATLARNKDEFFGGQCLKEIAVQHISISKTSVQFKRPDKSVCVELEEVRDIQGHCGTAPHKQQAGSHDVRQRTKGWR